MQVSVTLQCRLGTCAHRGTGILSNQIDTKPSDNGPSIVFVQTIQGQAVVEQRCRLVEYLAGNLEIHLGSRLGYGRCSRHELIERWVNGTGWHTGEGLSAPARRQSDMARPTTSCVRVRVVSTSAMPRDMDDPAARPAPA